MEGRVSHWNVYSWVEKGNSTAELVLARQEVPDGHRGRTDWGQAASESPCSGGGTPFEGWVPSLLLKGRAGKGHRLEVPQGARPEGSSTRRPFSGLLVPVSEALGSVFLILVFYGSWFCFILWLDAAPSRCPPPSILEILLVCGCTLFHRIPRPSYSIFSFRI